MLGRFEDSCRALLGSRGYMCQTLERIVVQATKQWVAMAGDSTMAAIDWLQCTTPWSHKRMKELLQSYATEAELDEKSAFAFCMQVESKTEKRWVAVECVDLTEADDDDDEAASPSASGSGSAVGPAEGSHSAQHRQKDKDGK